ncbi:DUF2958 domain-containing protein [Phyllobacterium phragmitis]|uniref:DUF2958 domain-containing protein n=1 Tax=Phyllobacterium phragmitis TaxID=2670329 RepID=UPI0038B3E5A9
MFGGCLDDRLAARREGEPLPAEGRTFGARSVHPIRADHECAARQRGIAPAITLFGPCDLGHGSPELGYASLAEIQSIRGPMRLLVERNRHFRATKPLSTYAAEARAKAGSSLSGDPPCPHGISN